MHSSIGIFPVAFIPPCKGIEFCFAKKKWIFYPNLSGILDFRVRNVFFYQIDVKNGFIVVELAKKVYLFIFVAFIYTGAKYFLKGSRKSNQVSKHQKSGHES